MRLSFGYRPETRVRRYETQIIKKIRTVMKDKNYVLWRNFDNVWTVSYIFPDGQWVDMAFCGSNQSPCMTPGTIISLKAQWKASKLGKGMFRGLERDLDMKRRLQVRSLQERNERDLDRRRYIRRRVGRFNVALADHPYFKVD